MALEATFRELTLSLLQLDEALSALQMTVGDKPLRDEAAVADALESAVLDLRGSVHEARSSAAEALKAVGYPPDLDKARRMLAVCQDHAHAIERQFSSDLVSYDKLRELARVGSERGGEWLPWANSLKQAIEECRSPLQHLNVVLSRCWQELAERLGMTNISVQTTNVGQKINVPSSASSDVETEGVT
jgi:hypothetical protein